MKTIKKRKTIAEIKNAIKNNSMMRRFVREIEREELLDEETLNTMFVFQWQRRN